MKIHQIQFSPTGTSARIASAIAAGIGYDTIVTDVTLGESGPTLVDAGDIAIMAAPVYGGHMPYVARKRMSLIRGAGSPCVLVAVYGNRAFERALADMAALALQQNFVPVAAAAFVGEHSYSTSVTPIAQGRPDEADIATATDFGRKIALRLADGTLTPADVTLLTDVASPEASLAAFGKFVAEYSRRRQVSPAPVAPAVDRHKCDSCGECAGVCPVDAISVDGLSSDPSRCIKCCACVKRCARGARTLASPFAPVLSEWFSIRKPPVVSF